MKQQKRELTYESTLLPRIQQTRWEREQQAVVRSVAHQIRSTLTSVSISAEALATDPDSPPHKVRRHCQAINDHAQHIGRLLDDLVSLISDRLDSSDVGIVELNEIVWEAAQPLWQLARHRSITLETPSGSESLVVQGKRGYLTQAIRGCLEYGILNLPEDSRVSVRFEPRTAVGSAGAVEIVIEYASSDGQTHVMSAAGRSQWDDVTMQAVRRILEAHQGDVAPLGNGRDGVRLLLPRHRAIAAGQMTSAQVQDRPADEQRQQSVA